MPRLPANVLVIKLVTRDDSFNYWSNISYWECASPPTTQAQIDSIADGAFVAQSAVIAPILASKIHINGAQATFVDGSSNQLIGISTSSEVAGQVDQYAMPIQNCLVIQKKTGKMGRQYTGRYFISGIAITCANADDPSIVDDVTSGNLGPQIKAICQYFGADRTYGGTLCHARHWDRKLNQMIPITACNYAERFATRRDRRRKVPDHAFHG